MRIAFLLMLLLTCPATATAEDAPPTVDIALSSKGALRIDTANNKLLIAIPDSVRKAIAEKWKGFRTIEQEDLPSIRKYWQEDADHGAKGLPSATSPYSFVFSGDVTGDGIAEIFLPVRSRGDECRWKIAAIHTAKDKKDTYEIYEVDSDRDGQNGPCSEGKPWYGFELSGAVGWFSVTYVPSSCFVANFVWVPDKGYVQKEQE